MPKSQPHPMSARPATRRPIKARDSKWAASIASTLARARIKPNGIPLPSVALLCALLLLRSVALSRES
jgi:hypothetical protein